MPPTRPQNNVTYHTTPQCTLSHYNRLPPITTIQHNTAYETTVYYCLSDYSTMPLIRQKHNHALRNKDADKSLARPGRKQATVTEDLDFRTSYL
jgi:hypothetical protein